MKRTQKDRRYVVASPPRMAYSAGNDVSIPSIQRPDSFGHRYYRGHELAAVGRHGGSASYRQSSAFRSLRYFGRTRAPRLAKTLGRVDIFGFCHFGGWHRNRSTFDECRTNGIAWRCRRQSDRRRSAPYSLSYFLDTTTPLRRRPTCAA